MIDELYPEELAETDDEIFDERHESFLSAQQWTNISAPESGYIQRLDGEAIVRLARKHDLVIRVDRGIGDFAIEGAPLVSVAGNMPNVRLLRDEIQAAFAFSRFRTVEQDVAFGMRQLTDIAIKALSPGVNDTTTAVMCVDYLTAILFRLAHRRFPSRYRVDEKGLRVVARVPTFPGLLSQSLGQIRQNAAKNVPVLARLFNAVDTLASSLANDSRKGALREQWAAIEETVTRTVSSPCDRADLLMMGQRAKQLL